MAVVQLNCPLCQGAFQVDESAAGQNVACPLCQGVVTIPAMGAAGGFSPGLDPSMYPPGFAPSAPAHFPPSAPTFAPQSFLPPAPAMPPPGDAVQLSCPNCAGVFQVTPEMAGQHLACPHCQSDIAIPALWGAASVQPQLPPEVPLQHFYPPGMSPPAARQGMLPPAAAPPVEAPLPQFISSVPAPEPLPEIRTREAAASARAQPMFPPGFDPHESKLPPPAFETQREMRPAVEERPAPRSKSVDVPAPSITRRPGGTMESLLPPGVGPSPGVESLLPPGPGTMAAADSLLPPGAAPSRVESLLPPGAAPASAPVPVQQVPLPLPQPSLPVEKPRKKQTRLSNEKILIPTDEGGYVTVREPVKTIGTGDNEIELKVLTPEEKAKRKLIRNLILGGFCLAVLFVTMVVLYLRG